MKREPWMSQHLDTLKICERNNGRVLSWFCFATATTIHQLKTALTTKTLKKALLFGCRFDGV